MVHENAGPRRATPVAKEIFPSQWNAESFKKAVRLTKSIDLDVELDVEISLLGRQLTTGAPVRLGDYRSPAEGLRLLRAETSTAMREMMGMLGLSFEQIAEDMGISTQSARKLSKPEVNAQTFALLMETLMHYGCEARIKHKVVGDNLPALADQGTERPEDLENKNAADESSGMRPAR